MCPQSAGNEFTSAPVLYNRPLSFNLQWFVALVLVGRAYARAATPCFARKTARF